jgi:hypothetical protein
MQAVFIVLTHGPAFEGVSSVNEHPAYGPLLHLDLKLPKSSGLVRRHAVAQRLDGVSRVSPVEGPSERRSAIGTGLLQHGICKPRAHRRLQLAPQSPRTSLSVEQSHPRPTEV